MSTIPKANVVNGNTIQATDVKNIIDGLDGTTNYDIYISGSLRVLGASQSSGSGHVLTYNTSSGTFSYTASSAIGGGSSTPGGADTYIQFNSASAFSGSSDFIFDYSVRSMRLGAGGLLTGTNSFIIGSGSKLDGNTSMLVGRQMIVSSLYSLGVGDNSTVATSANASAVVGTGLTASGSSQVVVGKYNITGDQTSRFIVGNGIDKNNTVDAFKVTHSSSAILPVTQSSVPGWTGVDGEFVFGTFEGGPVMWVYLEGGWKTATLA